MSKPRPDPCKCERLPFPHRKDWACRDFAEAKQELADNDEEWVDGTTKDVINWMRSEVGRG